MRFNGVDYPNSAHYVSLAPRKSATEPFEVVTTFGFVGESLAANDYVEIYWESDTSGVSLEAVPGTGHPDSGSVYVNVSNVAEVVTGQKGEPGDKGDKGDTGATGPTGPAGNAIISTDVNQVSYTSTNQIENYTLACELIPAGTFTTNDVLDLVGGIWMDGAATGQDVTFEIRIEPDCAAGTVGTPSGAKLVSQTEIGSDYYIVDKKLFVNGAQTQMGLWGSNYTYADASPIDNNSSTSNKYNASPFYVNHNIDWTIDQYLTIFVTMLATGQTVRCDHLMLAKINS